VLLVGMGLRNSYAMFLVPVTDHLHWTREQFSLGLAIQLLVWGLVQPFAGAIADRYGTGRVVLSAGCPTPPGWGCRRTRWSPRRSTCRPAAWPAWAWAAQGFAVVLAAMSSACRRIAGRSSWGSAPPRAQPGSSCSSR
jgi:MFS family permease